MLEGIHWKVFQKSGFRNFLDKVLIHMAVIDCGERKVDNNRWLWDLLAGSACRFPINLCKRRGRI